MADKRSGLRPKMPKIPVVESTPKPALTNKERCQQYRERIKHDRPLYEVFKASDTQRKRAERSKRTEEQRQRDRENSRKRSEAYRARKKASGQAPKRTTRHDGKLLADKRERNRLAQQKRRQNMSHQKRSAEKRRNRHYMQDQRDSMKCQQPEDNPATITNTNSDTTQTGATRALFTTPGARRTAAYRAKKTLSIRGLIGAVRSVYKKNPETMREHGVSFSSPSKAAPSAPDTINTVSEVETLISLKNKRDLATLNAKNIISVAANKFANNVKGVLSFKGISKRYLKNNRNVRKLYVNKDSQTKIAVTGFYRDHSLHLPGKESNGKKILDKPIKELHAMYLLSNPDFPVSQSNFFKMRPKTVLSYLKTPMKQCLCEIGQNPRLKLEVVNKNSTMQFDSLTSLVSSTMCSKTGEYNKLECIQRKCSTCKSKLCQLLEEADLEQEMTWKRWEKVQKENGSRLEIVRKSGMLLTLVDELKNELRSLPQHIFTHRWQSQQYARLTSKLPSGWSVATMDFAENYVCIQQDQPQSAYYGYSQVTLHPVVLNYACKFCGEKVNDGLVFISDSLKHNAHFVQHVQQVTEQHLSAVSSTTKLVIFSDGCPGQYKSKVPFCYLSQQDASFVNVIERCFFGARHGKNPCDALGGIIKSAVSRAVRSRQVIVQNAQDFFNYCTKNLVMGTTNECCHSVRSFIFLKKDQIVEKISSSELKTIPGTRQLHSLMPLGNSTVATRELSCFCESCRDSNYSECVNSDYVKAWGMIKFAPPKILSDHVCVTIDCSSSSREDFFDAVHHQLRQCNTFTDLMKLCNGLQPLFADWPLPVKYLTVLSVGGTVDSQASRLLPNGLNELYPLVIEADGNCMPRALSLAIFGSQQHHVEIRCRITCMLALRFDRYNVLLGPDMIKVAELSSCRSDRNIHDVGEIQRIYQQEALQTVNVCTDMSLWHLMAAADAVGRKILSVYPRKGPICNRKLLDRTVSPSNTCAPQAVMVMWTSCRTDEMPEEYWVASHISLLLPLFEPSQVVLEC